MNNIPDPHEWTIGDVITPEQLNRIEGNIRGSAIKISNVVNSVSTATSINLIDADQLLINGNIAKNDNVYKGKVGEFAKVKLTISGGFKPNTQYTFSINACRLEQGNTDTALGIWIYYTTGEETHTTFTKDTVNFTQKSRTSSAGKTVDYVKISWAHQDDVDWQVKDIMIVEGTTLPAAYCPHTLTARDDYARGIPSTGDTTDRTDEIQNLLTTEGICRLGKGTFYVQNLDMPKNSTLCGCGSESVIRLIGTSAGYAVRMEDNCSVKDLMISGAEENITVSSLVGNRHGILWIGDFSSAGGSGDDARRAQPEYGTISNCIIKNFTGGGITCDDTGPGTWNGLNVSNCWILYCSAGINIAYRSEFNRFTNVCSHWCYYGCVNNGGNNTFTNCGFSRNIVGMAIEMVDGSDRTKINNGHGSAINCLFNHLDRDDVTLGKGDAVHFVGAGSGFIFDGCQFFYSAIYLEDSTAVTFRNCNFGNMRTVERDDIGTYITVKATDTSTRKAYFSDCIFRKKPTIIKNQQSTGLFDIIWDNCYLRDGTPIFDNSQFNLNDIKLYDNFIRGGIYTDLNQINIFDIDTAHMNNDPNDDFRYYHIIIPCEEDDEFIIEARAFGSGGSGREEAHLQYVFTDTEYNVLQTSKNIALAANTDRSNYPPSIAKAPIGTAWLIVNHRNINNQYWFAPKVYKKSKNVITNYLAQKILGKLPYNPDEAWMTQVIAVYENMIAIFDGSKIKFSTDCGSTFNSGVDVRATLTNSNDFFTNAHIYANGCLAFFTKKHAYYIDPDWTSYHEAICYDTTGQEIAPETIMSEVVFKNYNDYAERKFITINGVQRDIYVFGNYKYGYDERALLWYSIDCGHTYKIGLDFGISNNNDSSVIINGYPLNIRHIHGIIYYEPKDKFICMTGDTTPIDQTSGLAASCVLELSYNENQDSWGITLLGTGRNYKWTSAAIWNKEIYYAYDNTPGKVMKCAYDDIGDVSRHQVVLEDMYNDPRHIIFGKRGDMLITQCNNRNITVSNFEAPLSAAKESRGIYYSTNRRDFIKLYLPVLQLVGSNEPAYIKPVAKDGSVYIGTYCRTTSGNNRDKGSLPSINIKDFIQSMGYPTAFMPQV